MFTCDKICFALPVGLLPLALGLFLVGCVGTEGGNPFAPEIDASKVALVAQASDAIEVEGQPGAVRPASASLRYVDLEGSGGFLSETVNGDGSFSFLIDADASHWFRFRALLDDQRSRPVDLVAIGLGGPLPRQSQCLVSDGDVVFEDGSAQVVVIRNECMEAATLMTPRLRFPGATFTWTDLETNTLNFGESTPLEITSASLDPTENILVVDSNLGPVAVGLWIP